MLPSNLTQPMKLTNLITYPGGWCLDILKFKKRCVIELSGDEASGKRMPSILLQIGPDSVFELSFGLVFYFLSLSIWCRHYDD